MASELKPCPFCGGRAEIWRAHSGDAAQSKRPAFVGCVSGCATVVTREFDNNEEAIAAWNRRVPYTPAQREEG